MKERFILYAAILCSAAIMVSFRWPLVEGSITSTFGESRWDHFHDGIDMVSGDPKVFPVEAGALLFFWDRAIFPMENYPGGGNYSILEHRNGLCSIYMHLENGLPRKSIYSNGDPVGIMGNTGHSFARHIHFSLVRPAEGVSVNPMTLLPALSDGAPPKIDEIAFRIGEKIVIVRDGADIRLTRHYPLLVKISDSVSGKGTMGVYRLSASHNGKQVIEVEFKNIARSPRGPCVRGMDFNRLFDSAGYHKIENIVYTEGENRVEISASDYAGNRAEKEFTFNVKLDMHE